MKKANGILLSVFTLLICCVFSASAATSGDFSYKEKTDGTIEITSYNGSEASVVIPATFDGKAVTSIGEMAFYENLTVTEVVLPDTVTEIGSRAFQNCAYLEKINFHEELELIKEGAFSECRSLTAYIPANTELEYPYSVFSCCKGVVVSPDNEVYSNDSYGVLFNKDKTELISYPAFSTAESYIVPETVKVIGDCAFASVVNLKSVVLPQGLEKIGVEAFSGAILLESVDFPSSLKEIGELAFSFSPSLNNIVLPDTIETVGFGAFAGCCSLEKTEVKSLNIAIGELAIGYTDRLPLVDSEEWIELHYAFATSIHGTEKYKTNRENYYNATLIPEEGIVLCDNTRIFCHSGSTAEAYAVENGVNYELTHFMGDWIYNWEDYIRERKCDFCDYTETEELEKNEIGDVEIVNPADPDTEFEVEDLEKSNDFILVEETVKGNLGTDYTVLKAFDITLKNKDGVHVQPDGTVKVKLPLNWEKDADYKVYRVNDDGTLTDMNAYRQGSHMVFDTDHFSIYVIVAEGEQVSEENDSDNYSFLREIISLFKDFFNLLANFFKSVIPK